MTQINNLEGGASIRAKLNKILGGEFDENLTMTPVALAGYAPMVAADSGNAGNVTGTLISYATTFITETGETTPTSSSNAITVTSKQINLSGIPISLDSRVIARRIYRNYDGVDDTIKKLVVEITDNTTTAYVDDIATASLGVVVPRIDTTGGLIFLNADRVAFFGYGSVGVGAGVMVAKTGYANSAFGFESMKFNTTGFRNAALGTYSLYANTEGNYNSSVGVHAMNDNTTGNNNTAVGFYALKKNNGNNNTAVGATCLGSNTTGTQNSGLGYGALAANTLGSNNVAIGGGALTANLTGNYNVGVGTAAIISNTAGNNNVGIGYGSLYSVKGSSNVGIGYESIVSNNSGSNNTAIGYRSLRYNVSGSGCVAIGYTAGHHETGSNKLFIDNLARTNEADGRIKALIYGVFDAATANQHLSFNAQMIDMLYIPTYADNAAAVTGGLPIGRMYKTATGEQRIVV